MIRVVDDLGVDVEAVLPLQAVLNSTNLRAGVVSESSDRDTGLSLASALLPPPY